MGPGTDAHVLHSERDTLLIHFQLNCTCVLTTLNIAHQIELNLENI